MGVIVLPCTDSPSNEWGSIRGIANQIMRVTREIKTRALCIKEFIFQINSNLSEKYLWTIENLLGKVIFHHANLI
jgi:hypothetical protein